MKNKTKVIITTGLGILVIGSLIVYKSYKDFWKRWDIAFGIREEKKSWRKLKKN